MGNNKQDIIIDKFLVRFNKMCEKENRSFLNREITVNYETGSRIKKYDVVHRLRKKNNEWLIEAVSDGWWIFKKKFPLLRITKNRNKISFTGMFTFNIHEFEVELLEKKLEEYLNTCKKQPNDVFTNS